MSAETSDEWEIRNLIARYAELLNLGQIDEVGALFRHGKITSEITPGAREGSEAVTEMYRQSVHFAEKMPDTLLFTSNLQIAVDGDHASGKAYFMALHVTPEGMLAPVVAGRYHDEFRRIDGTWWFHHRHMMPDLHGDISSHLTTTLEPRPGSASASE
jgi:ketosteroid isomerase-like protein